MDLLPKIADSYTGYYKILTKEEAITIISAEQLNSSQESRVRDALEKANPGVNFSLKFQVRKWFSGGSKVIILMSN